MMFDWVEHQWQLFVLYYDPAGCAELDVKLDSPRSAHAELSIRHCVWVMMGC